MKLTPSIQRKSGMTLLELTVVILVLLSLISILFIGARAWKKGSDRAGCILNIRNVQQAVRGHLNMMPGDDYTAVKAALYTTSTTQGYVKIPVCPTVGASSAVIAAATAPIGYTEAGTIPATGVLWLTCNANTATPTLAHLPATYTDW